MQEDLEALAPKVPAHVRAEIEEKDPTLDQDIADWFSPNCDRPRLTLLGPVTARTHGKALAKRKPYFTELLAFLALHRKHGATREQVAEVVSMCLYMGGGPSLMYGAKALDAFDQLEAAEG